MPFKLGLFITSKVNVNWNPSAVNCPIFDKLIYDYTGGDLILTERLLQTLGMILTNDPLKKIICYEGVTNSGKSFILNFIISLLNHDTVVSVSPNDFSRQFALAKIFNKNLCVCMDMPKNPFDTSSASIIKQISGRDTIGAEFKYQNGNVSFVSRAHRVLCSNFAIVPANNDRAFYERRVVVPFTHSISKEKSIQPDVLLQMLKPEPESIVNKLIHAYLRLKANNYVFSGTGMWYDNYEPIEVY